jgi:PAS domain-containing protein
MLISEKDSSLVNDFFNKYSSLFKSQQDQLLAVQNLHQQQIVNANRVLIFIAILTICFFGFSMWWLLQQITQKDNLLEENKSFIDIIQINTAAIKQLQEQEHVMAESLKLNNSLLESEVHNQTELITDVFKRIKQVYIGADSQLNIVYANGRLNDVFGVSAKDLLRQPLNNFLFNLAGDALTNLLKEDRPVIGKSNLEFIHPQNGKWYDASIYYADNGVSMIIRNINKNKLD